MTADDGNRCNYCLPYIQLDGFSLRCSNGNGGSNSGYNGMVRVYSMTFGDGELGKRDPRKL